MSDIPCGLSRLECQEELFKLRTTLLARVGSLQENAEGYYYLCRLVGEAPTAVAAKLQAEVVQWSVAYLADWQDLIAISKKAEVLLRQMESLAAVDEQLDELEAGETISICSAHRSPDPDCRLCNVKLGGKPS